MKPETALWIEMSEEDLVVARLALDAGLFSSSVFHCQLAAEKALKAIWTDRRPDTPPLTHNLRELAQALQLSTGEFEPFLDDLSNQAVVSRYVGAGAYTGERATAFLERTVLLCQALRLHLS